MVEHPLRTRCLFFGQTLLLPLSSRVFPRLSSCAYKSTFRQIGDSFLLLLPPFFTLLSIIFML